MPVLCFRVSAIPATTDTAVYLFVPIMKLLSCLCINLICVGAKAANLVLTNDDGWAEINVRTFYESLTGAGNSVVLSGPADNESGTGMHLAIASARNAARVCYRCYSG